MRNEIKTIKKNFYITPDIEVIEIESEQNILASGSGDIPTMPGEAY